MAVLAYAATNLDNLLLLTTWLVAPSSRVRTVGAGLALGMAEVMAVSYLVGWAVDVQV